MQTAYIVRINQIHERWKARNQNTEKNVNKCSKKQNRNPLFIPSCFTSFIFKKKLGMLHHFLVA